MRVVSLGSGSSGNAFYVEAGPKGRTKLLIDAGLSARTITTRLQAIAVPISDLSGILVTHEHSDHVRAIPVLTKRFGLSVIADPSTAQAIEEGMNTGVWQSDSGKPVSARTVADVSVQTNISTTLSLISETNNQSSAADMLITQEQVTTRIALPYVSLPAGTKQLFGDIEVTSFAISHDAVAPCGFLLSSGACRVCLITDSGEVTLPMLEAMSRADLLILEANHDREQLIRGPYPWVLKRRILSPTGHLSNEQAADAVLKIWRDNDLRWIWLAHLSRTNNSPQLAVSSIRSHLQAEKVNLSRLRMVALPPTNGPIWDSSQLWQ